jgi:hypothetical protein
LQVLVYAVIFLNLKHPELSKYSPKQQFRTLLWIEYHQVSEIIAVLTLALIDSPQQEKNVFHISSGD